jgi:hypothetical protein
VLPNGKFHVSNQHLTSSVILSATSAVVKTQNKSSACIEMKGTRKRMK